MAEPINMEDEELLDLMAALELETGVTAASVAAPAPAVKTAPVVTATSSKSEPSEEEVLLEALTQEPEATPTPGSTNLPAALLAGILSQQAAAVAKDPVIEGLTTAVQTTVAVEGGVSVEDELAMLEAGLADEPEAQTAKTQIVTEATARAVADEALTKRVEAPVAITPAPDASTDLAAHYSTLDFFVDPKKFALDTRLSDVELDKNMMEQNSLRAFYGSQAAQAEAQSARTKMKFEIIEAKLYDQHRRLLLENGEKVTEKMVENEVKKDPRWATAKGKVIDADTISSINRALVESLRDRQSMLVQLSADRRDEFKQNRSTMAQTTAQEEQRARAAQAAKDALG